MTEVERQRLFFALWPTPEQRAALVNVASMLPDDLGRRVTPANLHLTLAFLGGLTLEQRQAMEAVADDIVVSPFTLTLDAFGYWRRPQVVWAGSGVMPPQLLTLVKRLQQGAASCGLRVNTQPYAVHLTLYHKVRRAPRQWPAFPQLPWSVTQFALVDSLSDADGMRYEPHQNKPHTTTTDRTKKKHSVE